MTKWLIIIVILVAGAGYIVYSNPDYRAYFTRQAEDILPDSVSQTKAYRWKDKHGQWQLSDQPPTGNIKYEIVEYHKDTNVIPTERLTGKKK